MSTTPTELVDGLLADGRSEGATAGSGRPVERAFSLDWLRDNGLPTRHDESWKYTPLKDVLARDFDRLAIPDDGRTQSPDMSGVVELDDAVRLVVVDGVFRADLSDDVSGTGAVVSTLGDVPTDWVDTADGSLHPRADGFEMLNRGFGADGLLVDVPDGVAVETPIHVVHVSGDSDEALFIQPRVDIRLGVNSQLKLVETFAHSSQTAFVNAFSSVVLGADAILRHYKIQSQAIGSVHLSSISARQERGSSLKAGAFMFGGSIARQSVDVLTAGDRTTTDLYGLYLPRGSQQMDNVVTVDHAADHCASNQVYKGVIDDRARGAFSGHIIVDHGTVGTDAHQSNKTLLLDRGAQSDSRPWLEIFADDVDCTHGSAIGQLDESALFYMRSRGIALDDARAILVGGFINEIVERLTTESVKEAVMRLVKEHVRSGFTAELGGEG